MSRSADADIERRETEGPEEPQTDQFVFDDKAHAYFLNGKPMLGCTSVLGVIAKDADSFFRELN